MKIKKLFAIIITASLALSLAGCQKEPDNSNKGDNATVTENDDNNVVSENSSQADDELAKTPENVQKTAFELVEDVLAANGLTFDGGDITSADKKYGSVDKAEYILPDGGIINVTSYEALDDAKAYAGYYGSDGSHFTSDKESMIIDYIYPIHLWRYDNYIISYGSPTAEELHDLNTVFGVEFAGSGSQYYSPEFASSLSNALIDAGYGVTSEWCEELQQLYIHSPERMCKITVSNGDIIYLSRFKDESMAMDHAARFSHDGKTYTGFEGNSHISIQLGRDFSPHFFRGANVVAEYISESGELMSLLESVYGKQFAGENSDTYSEPTPVEFTVEYLRTDFTDFDVEVPQYAVIRSADDLNRFYTDYNGALDLERHEKVYSDTTIGWLDQSSKYSDEWFKSNDLLLIVLSEGSGSNRHEVASVVKTQSGTSVSIKRIVPDVGTDDMAGWTLFIEVKGKVINPLEKVEIEISEIKISDDKG